MRTQHNKISLVTAIALANLSVPAFAQNEDASMIEEIVVTAQYREQTLQDVPIAISAYSTDDLADAGITDLQGISRLAPDFTAVNDQGFVRLSLRGIQSNSGDESQDQALTFNIDGEYINRGNFINTAMFDLERVEVLRGPQGTLYGRNATGGAVNAIAIKPELGELTGSVSGDVGNYGSVLVNGAVNVPIGETVAIRAALMSSENDGYTSHPNFSDDSNSQDLQAGRVGILIEPTEALSIYAAVEHAESTEVPAYAAISANTEGNEANPDGSGSCSGSGWVQLGSLEDGSALCAPQSTNYLSSIDRDDYFNAAPLIGYTDKETTAFRGKIAYELDNMQIAYSFGLRDSEADMVQPLSGLLHYRGEEVKSANHEIRFTGGDDDGLFWQAGVFYFEEKIDNWNALHLPFGGAADPEGFGIWLNTAYRDGFESTSVAAFGQLELPLSESVTAVVGGRYTKDKKSVVIRDYGSADTFLSNGGFENVRPIDEATDARPGDFDNGEFTWTAGINFTPESGGLHYAKVSKGYKAGGFDPVGSYDPETVIAFEVGSKNTLNDTNNLNVSAFFYDYKDLQANVLLDTAIGGQVFNAGSAEIYGIDFEYEWLMTDQDRLAFTANYLQAEYVEFEPLEQNIQCIATDGSNCDANTIASDANGHTMPNSPEWLFTIGYDHIWDLNSGTLTASLFSRYKGEYYNDIFNLEDGKQESYTQTDINLTYEHNLPNGDVLKVLAYVRNIEDERPINYFTYISAGPNDDINWSFGAPRTYGLSVGYSF